MRLYTHAHTHGIVKRKTIYGIKKLIIFLTILFICLQLVNNITKRKNAYNKMSDFISQTENFDVLFFGSSHTMNGIYPMEMWNDYGIVSYNMGNASEVIAMSYYNMLLALRETKPQLVVIDVFLLYSNSKIPQEKAKVHTFTDSYPLSYTKYLAIKDLFGEKENALLKREIEYLFPFSAYHSRWSELTKNDFDVLSNPTKGAEVIIDIATPISMGDFDSVEPYNGEETINMQYLRKIIEHCRENNIEVLVTYLPHTATNKRIADSKYVQIICDEYNVNYINFLNNMNVIDYNIDFKNSQGGDEENSHLNPSGARKVTDYLGKYIMDNYNIPDQRENESYSFWYEDYDEYIDFKISNLAGQEKNLNNYLMLLYGEKDIKYDIKISSKKEIKEGSILKQLLENLDNNYEINDEVFKEKQDKTIKITTWDNRNGKLIKEVWF